MSKTTNYKLDKYDDNNVADFGFINGSLDKIDTELKNVSDKANTKEIIIKNVTLLKNKWVEKLNGFVYNFNDSEINRSDVVDINFSTDDILNGYVDDILSSTEATNGFVNLFSKTNPTKDLPATMVIHKGAI